MLNNKIINQIKDKQNRDILITLIIKALSFIAGIFSLEIFARYLNQNVILGVWLTVTSIVNWINFFDLGIGNGLRNNLSKYLAKNDKDGVREHISSAYYILLIFSAALLIIGIPICYLLNWNNILSVSTDEISKKMLIEVMLIMVIGIVIHLYLKTIISILYAAIKNVEAAIVSFLSNSLILLFAFVMAYLPGNHSIRSLAILYVISFNLPLIVVTFRLFLGEYRYALPRARYITKQASKAVFTLGNTFFIMQIALLIINSTNDYLISHWFGNSFVVDYNAYFKIASAVSGGFLAITNPIWAHISNDNALEKYDSIRRTSKKLFFLAGLACVACLSLVVLFKPAFSILYKTVSINTSFKLNLIMAIYGCVLIIQGSVSCIANGLNTLKVQLIIYSIGAIVKIPLVYLFKGLYDDWVVIVIVNFVIMLTYIIVQLMAFSKNKVFKTDKNSEVIVSD